MQTRENRESLREKETHRHIETVTEAEWRKRDIYI